MTRTKRITALLLTLALLFTLLPGTALGAEVTEKPVEVVQETETEETGETEEDADEAAENESAAEEAEKAAEEAVKEAETEESTEPATVSEEAIATTGDVVASGVCGDDLTWVLDGDYVLTISGTGEMDDANVSGDDPDDLTVDGCPWYEYHASIKEVVIESSVTSIGMYAFYNCSALTEITIPDSVSSIGALAFFLCTSLTSVEIPNGVTDIQICTFENCESLTSVTIPDSVTSIGEAAFSFCTSLTSVEIPDSVTSIEINAFYCCSALKYVTIGSGLTSIGDYAFWRCFALESITVASGNTAFASEDGVLFDREMTELICYPIGNSRTTYTIPDGVTTVGRFAFYYCTSLTSIDFPSSIALIRRSAFYQCTLDEIHYDGSVESWLLNVEIEDENTTLSEAAFYDGDGNLCSLLSSVSISTLKITSTGIALSWSAVSDADGYWIYRKTASGAYQLLAPVGWYTSIYTDTAATDGTTYYYYVQAYTENAVSLWIAKWITYLASTVTDVADLTPETSSNSGDQNYNTAASSVNSYLVETDDGLMRVEYTGSQVVVEYYDSEYNVTAKKYVTVELELFGGFYAGEDAYYLVFGQSNYDEDDSVEVVRVVQYSTDWERIGQASLYGANTYIPFHMGSCRIAEKNGTLYIRTCQQMYMQSDGVRHQANMEIYVTESTMTAIAYYYDNFGYVFSNTYVSHSFNQFVMIDDEGRRICVDQGDGYPRGIAMNGARIFSFNGSTGNNKTGASLGGLEYSSTSYLVAGNSVTQDDSWDSHTARNVFVTVTDRDNISSSGTTVRWITDYDTDGDVSASTPQLVKLDTDSFLLLWTTTEYLDDDIIGSQQTKLHYVYLDGEGNTTSEIYTVNGQLSDCQPIVSDGAAIWYVTGDRDNSLSSAPCFCSVSAGGVFTTSGLLDTPVFTVEPAVSSGFTVTWNAVDGADGYYVCIGHGDNTSPRTDVGNTTSATIALSAGYSGQNCAIWVVAYSDSGKISLTTNKTIWWYLAPPTVTLTNASSGIQLSWSAVSGAETYQIYRKAGEGDYTLLATTEDTAWTDDTAEIGVTYTYQVYTCAGEHISGGSGEKSVTWLATSTLLSVENCYVTKYAASGIMLTWTTVSGCTEYSLYFKNSSGTTFTNVTAGSDETQSYAMTGLTGGATYEVYVVARYSDGSKSEQSNTMTILHLKTPIVTLSDTDDGIGLSWSAVTGAEEYKIYRKSADDEYTLLATTEDVAWTDTSAADGVTYTYQVYACAGDEISGGSPEKSMAHLSAPTLVSLENVSGGIQVTWSTVSGAESYRVYYKASTGTAYTVYSVTADSGSTQSVTRSLTSGTTYDFYVVACAGDSVSEASETMTILCLKAPTVTLVNVSSGIQLSWSAVTGAEEYDIYRKPENGAYALHATTTDTLWVDADVTDGAAYTYQVYARTDSYTSAGSGEKSLMWLAIPTLLSVENTSGGVQVTWRTVSGATTYRVYYKASTASTFSNYVNATAGSDSTQSVTMNLTGGTSYDFYIAAYASGSLSAASETMTILYLKTPAVTLTKTDTGVQLSWSAITGAEEYQIYRRSGDGAYALLAATEDVTWLDSDITEGVTYTYQVFARADAGVSAGSTEVVYKAGSIAACTITLSATSYTYNGTARKPTVTVKDGSTTLTSGTDYTVAYSNNTNAGTATVTVTGKGNYTGTATVTFTINKASQTVSASIASSGIQAGETTQITASTTGDGALSYQSSNTAIATVSSSGLVTGIAAGATTITVTAASTANYNSATKTVSVTVTEAEATDISACTITLSTTGYTYDGTAKKPTVTVKNGSTTLTSGTDYTVAYSDNTNAGTATVTVTGKGNYTGTATATFTISKASQTVSASIASSGIQAGETTQITASTTGDGALSYESSDTAIATVSSSGLVTGVAAGAATITVTAASTVNYNAAAKTLDVTVTAQELTAPTITSLYNSTSGVSVGWDAVDGAAEYIVWRLNNSTGKWEKCATTTGTTYLSTSPVSGTTYYYAIEAVNGEVTSGRGTQRYILYMATPKVSLENTTSGIKVSWNSVTGATSGYQVYRRTADTDYVLLKQVSTSTTSYTDTTAEAGVRYYYIVRSVRGSARSAYASQYITRLTTPTGISVSNTKSGVQVTWSAVTGATSYQVWRKLSGSSSWSKVGTTTGTSYTSTGVTSGKTYVFTVKAVYNSSVSAYNTTGKTIMRLAEPTITLENLVGGLTASWNAVDGAKGYKLYRRSETGSYVLVATLDANTLTYTDKAAGAGLVFYYRVQAYSGSYTSSWTSQFNRRIGHTTLTLAKGEDGVVLTWTKSGGCTGYYIYRMNEDGSYTRIKTITSANTLTWTDTDVDLASGNIYTYIVRGYNGSSLGSYTPKKTSDFF